MSFQHRPKIVTDGLVFCIDAAAKRSYPGSGTTWYDLSPNGNNVTLNDSPANILLDGGAFDFDGTSDYANVVDYGGNFPTGDFSIDAVFKRHFTSSTENAYILYLADGFSIYFRGSWANDTCYFMRKVNGSSYYGGSAWSGFTAVAISSANMGSQTLTHVCATMESNSTTGIGRAYKSGSLSNTSNLYVDGAGGTNNNGGFQTPTSTNDLFLAATSTTSNKFDCTISSLKIYNKVLTPDEVTQNYNAHKSRYNV